MGCRVPTAVQFMLIRLGSFLAAGAAAYLVLSVIFSFVCLGLGHNTMEMMYGGTALYVLTLAAAVEGAWLLPDEIRNSPSVARLTRTSHRTEYCRICREAARQPSTHITGAAPDGELNAQLLLADRERT
jgi:hypothetical protein